MTRFAELTSEIIWLATSGTLEDLQDAIHAGKPFRGRAQGMTLLHFAARYGRMDSVRFLVSQGHPGNGPLVR